MNTIMFDLDGTLLPLEMDAFESEYFKRLCIKLKDMFSPDILYKCIWDGTREMVLNTDPAKTNKEIFMKKFCDITKTDKDIMYNLFMDFYRNEFDSMKTLYKPSAYIKDSINILKEKGYKLIVATNPIFPMEAIIERINWAGLNEDDFMYITSFEHMHFCKPQIHYYKEIMNILDLNPVDCLMVGNDVEEDLVSSKIGIKTYLIVDHMLNKKKLKVESDYKGTYKEFYQFVCSLPDVNSEESIVNI